MKYSARSAITAVLVLAAGAAAATDVTRQVGEGTDYSPESGNWYDAYSTYWEELKGPDVAACKVAKQSPIMLTSSAGQPARGIGFSAAVGKFEVARDDSNHHTVQLKVSYQSEKDVAEILQPGLPSLPLTQFHFHHPSEHLLDRRRYPMEMHLVHKSDVLSGRARERGWQSRIAVVAVFLQVGPNPRQGLESLTSVFAAAKAKEKPTWTSFPNTTAYDVLLPPVGSRDYLHYTGSLTTPECAGDVTWYVMKTPVSVSQAFVTAFQEVFEMNARWPQTLDGRTIANGRPEAVKRRQPASLVPVGR